MKIQYQEHSMQSIMDFFVNAYEKPVADFKWFYNPQSDTVVLKLCVAEGIRPRKTFATDSPSQHNLPYKA